MSNHMANRENWLELMNENMAAKALTAGICPVKYQTMKTLKNRTRVDMAKTNPRK